MTTELEQYDYVLPRELIAQNPLAQRADARLMVVDRTSQTLDHRYIRDLPELLQPGDQLVLNDTRVVRASLAGRRTKTGGKWQGLYLSATPEGLWRVLGKTRGKIDMGETVTLLDCDAREDVCLRLVERQEGGVWLAFLESGEATLDVLQRVGRVPLPHYIRDGQMIPPDVESYQTVFARVPGAVAAPTAGLHFTEPLLAALTARGVQPRRLTLHVGMGTFRPIASQMLAEHRMHAEWSELTPEVASQLEASRLAGSRIVAVGTTCVRTLETAAQDGEIAAFTGETELFIRPPYEFRAVDVLLTNFHLPRSTLLVLVRTFGGDALIRRAYETAIRERYRFYSYGDAMLIV